MANNWSMVSPEDLEVIKQNKVNWHNTDNQAYRDVYNMNNNKIRERYGMTEADDISLGELETYIALADKKKMMNNTSNALLTDLTNYAQNGSARVNASANNLRNFNYNPMADPSYHAYADMYNRQGQSAAKQTLNNLNAANMGRNSSYGAAATAQVQQAYAQKASEMIPVLEQQAYERLMNQYNMERQMFNDDYQRNMDMYRLLYETQAYEDEHNQNVANLYATNIQNQMGELGLDAYPTQLKQEIEMNALKLIEQSYNNENLAYKNRIDKVAAVIAETYGLSREQAEIAAVRADTAYTQSRTY